MKSLVIAFVVFMMTGCVASLPSPAQHSSIQEKKDDVFFIYKVKLKSESLEAIAAWYTGNSANISSLMSATPGIITSKLNVGEIILIPEQLVVTRDDMPAQQQVSSQKKAKHKPDNPQSNAIKVEELHPNQTLHQDPAAVIGIYRFDQLPTPKGETPESLQALFRTQGKGESKEERRRRELTEELLRD